MGYTPAHHFIDQLAQGNAGGREAIGNVLRWMRYNDVARDELILFQFAQLFGEHLLTDPGHASFQRPEPVDVVLDQIQNDGLPFSADHLEDPGHHAKGGVIGCRRHKRISLVVSRLILHGRGSHPVTT